MLQQLNDTIKWDGDTGFLQKSIDEMEVELSTITAASVRSKMLQESSKEIIRHEEELAKDRKKCDQANLFISQFFNSLKA
jgi:hypothetical protein